MPSPPSELRTPINKTGSIRNILRRLAIAAGPGGQLPTIRQLRTDLGVSLSTLNSALAELETEGILIRRHGSGIYASPNIGRLRIALVVEPLFFYAGGGSPTWTIMVESAFRHAQSRNDVLSVVFTRLDVDAVEGPGLDPTPFPESLIRDVNAEAIDGILAIGTTHASTRWLESRGVPVVSYAGAAAHFVMLIEQDLHAMALDAVVRSGCRRIVTMADSSWLCQDDFEAAVKSRGLTWLKFPESPLPSTPVKRQRAAGSHVRRGFQLMQRWLDEAGWVPEPTDAVVSLDDVMSQGALMSLDRHGYRVGRDLQFVSQSIRNSPVLLGWEDRITRVEYDFEHIVSLMYRTLLSKIDEEEPYLEPTEVDRVRLEFWPEHVWIVLPELIEPKESQSPSS